MHMTKTRFLPLALIIAASGHLSGSQWNKLTRLHVNEPISIPGATLKPGEYVVKLASSPANRHIVRFTDANQTRVIATVLAIPNRRLQPSGQTELGFYETPAGEPVALRSWFYPGDNFGQEFVYPEKQARSISSRGNRHVPVMSDSMEKLIQDTSADPDADPPKDFESTVVQSWSPQGMRLDLETGFAENAKADGRTPVRSAQRSIVSFVTEETRTRTEDRSRRGIAREVRHELVMLPYYGVFDHFQFQVDGETVTLSGKVTRPTLKSAAENVVTDIEGVERVVNNIEVLPVSPNDDGIRRATYTAIYGHTALQRYGLQAVPPIHIIVENGNVTLEGVVASEADKNIAGIQAKSVSGVFSVTNNLRVEQDR
jgi:hyperosmotically inducible protein